MPVLTRNPDRQNVKPVPILAKPSCDCLARHAPRRPIVGPSSCFQGPMKPSRSPTRQAEFLQLQPRAARLPPGWHSGAKAPERPQQRAGRPAGPAGNHERNNKRPQTCGRLKRSNAARRADCTYRDARLEAVSAIPKDAVAFLCPLPRSRPQGSPIARPYGVCGLSGAEVTTLPPTTRRQWHGTQGPCAPDPIAAPAPVTRPGGWGLDAGPVSLLQMWRPGIQRRHDGAIDQKTKETDGMACVVVKERSSRPSTSRHISQGTVCAFAAPQWRHSFVALTGLVTSRPRGMARRPALWEVHHQARPSGA